MNKTILITGASSGIGAACVQVASQVNLNVIATARSHSKLLQLEKNHADVQIIVADIATETGRNIIDQSIKQPIDYLLHSAAILDKPQSLCELSVADFRNNIVTNVEPLLFLTQKLIPKFKAAAQTGRILSISSGAAKYAIAGLGHYCVSKAAALMANQILKLEMPKHGVIVNDYFPGAVDTPMQKTLRSSSQDIFPYSDGFKSLKKDNKLSQPCEVATHILSVFLQTDDEQFAKNDWIFKKHTVLDK